MLRYYYNNILFLNVNSFRLTKYSIYIINKKEGITMRFFNKAEITPEFVRMQGKKYVFDLGGKEFFSDDENILSREFRILGTEIIPLDCSDGKRLVLVKLRDGISGKEVEVIDAYHASIFSNPFPVRYFSAVGQRGYFNLYHIYLVMDDKKSHITIRLVSTFFFGLIKFKSEQVQICL
jgi:hypothetical protein